MKHGHPLASLNRRAITLLQLSVLMTVVFLLSGVAKAATTINIHAIQTDLPNSPYMGDSVTTEGIVIAVLSDGFYIENSSSTSNCTDTTTLN